MMGANPTTSCFISSYRSLSKGLRKEFVAEWGPTGPSLVRIECRILDALPMCRQLLRPQSWRGSTRMISANLRAFESFDEAAQAETSFPVTVWLPCEWSCFLRKRHGKR